MRCPTCRRERRSPLSPAEAKRIRFSPATHVVCGHCGFAIQDIERHYRKRPCCRRNSVAR